MKSRVESLLARHRELDRQIDCRRNRHGNTPETNRLKRVRLAIKDELLKLRVNKSNPAV